MSRSPEALVALARRDRLYPALILHGGSAEKRREAALALARTLLCEGEEPESRPCGACRHCRRIAWPDRDAPFHPDFAVLERDLRTVTSAEATRELLRAAQSSPFEARGQVFVVAEADTLSAGAGDALLKQLEEPGLKAPRHFLLLAPSRLDLPETLRSRSLAVYLGAAEATPEEVVGELAEAVTASLERSSAGGHLHLLEIAGRLAKLEGFDDPRAGLPWIIAASAVRRAALDERVPRPLRRPLFALAEDLLAAPPMRLRGISPERIVEGLVARRLAATSSVGGSGGARSGSAERDRGRPAGR